MQYSQELSELCDDLNNVTVLLENENLGASDNESVDDSSSIFSVYSVENFHDDWVKPKQLDMATLKRNALCEICYKVISFVPAVLTFSVTRSLTLSLTSLQVCACCIYCNCVSHINCLNRKQKRLVFKGNFVCYLCLDDIEDSKKAYVKKIIKSATHYKQGIAQTMICKNWYAPCTHSLTNLLTYSLTPNEPGDHIGGAK